MEVGTGLRGAAGLVYLDLSRCAGSHRTLAFLDWVNTEF
jgi:hypothetical protein